MTRRKIAFPAVRKSLFQLLGPSIIFVALSLNGGELMIWPSLVANYSMKILWAVPIILILQFFVNMEIERYTLVTGNSVTENLVGKVRWLAIVFAIAVLFTLVWPAWMTTAGNLLVDSFAGGKFPEEQSRIYGLIITIVLMFGTLLIFRFKETYKILERVSKIGLAIALSIIIGVVIYLFRLDFFVEGITGLFAWGYIPADLPRFDFLGALAFGGVAGVLNLVQSEWVREKGYGVSSVKEKDKRNVEYESEKSKKNFSDWFSIVNKEHFILFFGANMIGIFMLAFLGRLLLPLGTAQGYGVLTAEIMALNAELPYLGMIFGISTIMIFTMANIVILDVIGRLSFQLLKPVRQAGKLKSLTSSNISRIAVLLGIGVLLLSVFFPNFRQPYFLLIIAASLSSMTMWLYPPLLLKMNLKLPKATRPSTLRIIMILISTFFYGLFSLWALSTFLPIVLVVLIGLSVSAYQVRFLIKG